MKKYCLTPCFKRKMSKLWKNVTMFIVIFFVLLALLVAVGALSYGIGWTIHYFGFKLDISAADLGLSTIGITFVISWLIYTVAKALAKATTWTTKAIIDRYENKDTVCHIFEECKDEEDEARR